MSNSLRPHESQHARPPCPLPTPGVYPNPCPLSQWCHPAISSSVVPFSYCPQSFPALGSFPMSQLFASSGQSIGVSASTSVLPMNTQDWSPLGWTYNNTREDFTHGHQQMVNTEIRLIIFFAAKDGEALYSQQKQDWELTLAQIMNSLLPNSELNWRK